MTESRVELPDEVCFGLTEMGELLNLLSWLKELLAAAENPRGVERVTAFTRMAQRQDVVDDPDEPGEG